MTTGCHQRWHQDDPVQAGENGYKTTAEEQQIEQGTDSSDSSTERQSGRT